MISLFRMIFVGVLAIAAEGHPAKVLFLGDSLTEGYGIDKDKAYPALVEEKFATTHQAVQAINAGISGSTSASGVSRLKWYLKGQPPQALFLALGANDGLRGQSTDGLKKNLREVIELAKAHHIQVLLTGMYMPPNYGKTYATAFHKAYVDLAAEEKIAFLPFLLEGVALHPELLQADKLHPNEKGHEIIAENVFKFLQAHLTALNPKVSPHAN